MIGQGKKLKEQGSKEWIDSTLYLFGKFCGDGFRSLRRIRWYGDGGSEFHHWLEKQGLYDNGFLDRKGQFALLLENCDTIQSIMRDVIE